MPIMYEQSGSNSSCQLSKISMNQGGKHVLSETSKHGLILRDVGWGTESVLEDFLGSKLKM